MHCIYCGKDTSQTTSREHVISACFGGRAKLPLGMVCEDCNELVFSKLEAQLARGGLFAMVRSFEGPGKRGFMDIEKAFVGPLVTSSLEDGTKDLTYTIFGQPHCLPSLLFNLEDFLDHRKMAGSFERQDQTEGFIKKLRSLDWKKIKRRPDQDFLKEGEVLIFYNLPQDLRDHKKPFKGFEEKYFQIRVHPLMSEEDLDGLFQVLTKANYRLERKEKRKGQVWQKYSFTLDWTLLSRYACKLLVNGLAYFEGADLVENEAFADIKSFVVRGEGDYPVQPVEDDAIWGILDQIGVKGDYRHFVSYAKSYQPLGILGLVSLYGFSFMTFIPYDWRKNKDIMGQNGLYVDFKNGQEVTWYDLLRQVSSRDF